MIWCLKRLMKFWKSPDRCWNEALFTLTAIFGRGRQMQVKKADGKTGLPVSCCGPPTSLIYW
jgi:hypothetical protein